MILCLPHPHIIHIDCAVPRMLRMSIEMDGGIMNRTESQVSGNEPQRRRARRWHLWHLMNQGYSLRESVQQTAAAYQCSERTVYHDWSTRGYWLAKELLAESVEEYLIIATADMTERRRQTLEVLRKSREEKNLAVQLGCLKLLYKMDQTLLNQGRNTLRYINRGLMYRAFDNDIVSKYFRFEPKDDDKPHNESAS